MQRPFVLLQKVGMIEADERRSEARRIFARIEVYCWLLIMVSGAAGTLLLKSCGTASSETVSESTQLFIRHEWQMVFENQRSRVLLDAMILSQPITDSGEPEVLFKQQSEDGGFSGLFIADGKHVELDSVPLSTYFAISVDELVDLLRSDSLCLNIHESICISQYSREKSLSILEEQR